jgi:hypothetical protein
VDRGTEAPQLIDHLLGDNFSPDVIREIDQMTDFDLYDFFGHHGYHARALKRPERGALFISGNQPWFADMDPQGRHRDSRAWDTSLQQAAPMRWKPRHCGKYPKSG